MRPDGSVLAMVGGRDYDVSQFNRAVSAQRQPGSTFKLFVYLAALRNGYRLQDQIEDVPVEVRGWSPSNYDDEYADGPRSKTPSRARSTPRPYGSPSMSVSTK